MTPQELRQEVLSALAELAPEANMQELSANDDVRDALDLDSMDILRFATMLHDRLGVDVPETDYNHIVNVDDCVDYLQQHLS